MKAVVWVDQGISDYYHSLIPKYYYVRRQMYSAHITMVRNNIETPDLKFWNLYQNEQITFFYSNSIKYDGVYFYLDAKSPRMEEIRLELGLPRFRFDGKEFHITIGNTKLV